MDTVVKTGVEIGILASRLTSINQAFVLNTINAMLFCQQQSQIIESNTKEEEKAREVI